MRNWTHFLGTVAFAAIVAVSATARQSPSVDASDSAKYALGPEMTEYMTFLDAELAELSHLHEVGEVSAKDFRLSRDRLDATREAAIRLARSRDEDRVPDLYLLVDRELTQILPAGVSAVRGKKVGDAVGDDFIFHGRIRRSVSFNILERTGNIRRASPYSPH